MPQFFKAMAARAAKGISGPDLHDTRRKWGAVAIGDCHSSGKGAGRRSMGGRRAEQYTRAPPRPPRPEAEGHWGALHRPRVGGNGPGAPRLYRASLVHMRAWKSPRRPRRGLPAYGGNFAPKSYLRWKKIWMAPGFRRRWKVCCTPPLRGKVGTGKKLWQGNSARDTLCPPQSRSTDSLAHFASRKAKKESWQTDGFSPKNSHGDNVDCLYWRAVAQSRVCRFGHLQALAPKPPYGAGSHVSTRRKFYLGDPHGHLNRIQCFSVHLVSRCENFLFCGLRVGC